MPLKATPCQLVASALCRCYRRPLSCLISLTCWQNQDCPLQLLNPHLLCCRSTQEMEQAVEAVQRKVQAQQLRPGDVTPATLEAHLYTQVPTMLCFWLPGHLGTCWWSVLQGSLQNLYVLHRGQGPASQGLAARLSPCLSRCPAEDRWPCPSCISWWQGASAWSGGLGLLLALALCHLASCCAAVQGLLLHLGTPAIQVPAKQHIAGLLLRKAPRPLQVTHRTWAAAPVYKSQALTCNALPVPAGLPPGGPADPHLRGAPPQQLPPVAVPAGPAGVQPRAVARLLLLGPAVRAGGLPARSAAPAAAARPCSACGPCTQHCLPKCRSATA